MRSTKHILLGLVIATLLFCSFGFYDSDTFSDGTLQYFGSGRDVSLEFDGTNFELFSTATADMPWAIGGTSYGFDITIYFETEGTIDIDYDGDNMTFSDTISLVFGTDSDWTIGCGTTKILQLTPVGDETYAVYIGADTAGADLKLFGALTGEYLLYDSSAGTLNLVSSSASDAGGTSIRPLYVQSTMTGVGGVGGRSEFKTSFNVAMGTWVNAAKAYLAIGDSGSTSGLASALLGEIQLPGALTVGGTYAALELEIVTQENGDATSTTDCFQYMQISGDDTATASWDASSYLFIIKGLTDATGNVFDTDTTPTCDATLRILVGGTPYYILLSSSPTS